MHRNITLLNTPGMPPQPRTTSQGYCILLANKAMHWPGLLQARPRAEPPVLAAATAAQRAQASLVPAYHVSAAAPVTPHACRLVNGHANTAEESKRHGRNGPWWTLHAIGLYQKADNQYIFQSLDESDYFACSCAPWVAAEAGLPRQQQRARLELLRSCLLLSCRMQLRVVAPSCLHPVRQPPTVKRLSACNNENPKRGGSLQARTCRCALMNMHTLGCTSCSLQNGVNRT